MTLSLVQIFLPGYYYVIIRSGLYSFIFNRVGFIAIAIYLIGSSENVPLVIFGFMLFVLLYEIGYIDNDYFAVRNEQNPSIRLSQEQPLSSVIQFIIVRLFYAVIVIFFILNLDDEKSALVCYFATINLIIYLIHNRLIRKHRLPTYLILKASHVIIPLIPVISNAGLLCAIVFFYLPAPFFAYMCKIDLLKIKLNTILRCVYFTQVLLLFFIFITFELTTTILCTYFLVGEIARMGKKILKARLV